jgi:hypothetical protein
LLAGGFVDVGAGNGDGEADGFEQLARVADPVGFPGGDVDDRAADAADN